MCGDLPAPAPSTCPVDRHAFLGHFCFQLPYTGCDLLVEGEQTFLAHHQQAVADWGGQEGLLPLLGGGPPARERAWLRVGMGVEVMEGGQGDRGQERAGLCWALHFSRLRWDWVSPFPKDKKNAWDGQSRSLNLGLCGHIRMGRETPAPTVGRRV